MKMVDFVVYFAGAVAALVLAGGYLGMLHPFFDSIAVIRLHLLISLVIVTAYMLLRRARRGGVLFGSVLVISLATMSPHFLLQPDSQGITLLQSNMLFRNDARELVSFARDSLPDILTLQEVTDQNRPSLIAMKNIYPTQNICTGSGATAILSKYPPIDDMQGCDRRIAWVRVMTPDGPVTIVSLHLLWPWPYNQQTHLDTILPILEKLPRPIIVAGDFNTVPWSNTVRQIETATQTRIISGIRLSFDVYKGWGRFPIDHVLVPNGNGSATMGPKLGSDHNLILVNFFAFTPYSF